MPNMPNMGNQMRPPDGGYLDIGRVEAVPARPNLRGARPNRQQQQQQQQHVVVGDGGGMGESSLDILSMDDAELGFLDNEAEEMEASAGLTVASATKVPDALDATAAAVAALPKSNIGRGRDASVYGFGSDDAPPSSGTGA
jgi:microcystin-dependent protein